MKICEQKNGKLTEADRLALATLLIKAGYTVRIDREKIDGKNTYKHFIEATERQVG